MDRFESDMDVTFYTGFPSRIVFKSVFLILDPGNKGENIGTGILMTQLLLIMRGVMKMPPIQARKTKTIKPKGIIFLTLCRLRKGFKEEHLSYLYGISQTRVCPITISWVNFMFLKF